MKNQTKKIQLLVPLFLPAFLLGCSSHLLNREKIDREAVVSRHNITVDSINPLSSLSVGNGGFAFTVDATGLQTFPEVYNKGVVLGTMSDWGWHSFPNEDNFRLEETYQYFNVEGRQVPYAVRWKEPVRKQDAANYFRENPHHLQLGGVGLELLKSENSQVDPKEIQGINQHLDLWKGLISSSFLLGEERIDVQTCCHPERDMIGLKITSEGLKKGLIGLNLRFSYPFNRKFTNQPELNKDSLHHSEIIRLGEHSAVFVHVLDTTRYYVKIVWSGHGKVFEKKLHYFVLSPGGSDANFSASVEFSSIDNFKESVDFSEIVTYSAQQWSNFWNTGGAIDFSGTVDPRAFELERRVVLSRYLTRIQCAGKYPPQETGLTQNSWYGKFHLEMYWWHAAHWAYWDRIDILEKSLGYYAGIFEKAKEKAVLQGYEGVRWPKMVGPSGNDSPSEIGEFLIWQQPHIIYFAEQCYRVHKDKATLEKYSPLVFATADFMADFARWDDTYKRYILGPPLIPAQETLGKEETVNPPFELAYWRWGLSVAQQWRKRMDLPVDPRWQEVFEKLSPLAQRDSLYLAAESAHDSYSKQCYISDHPMVLGAFGILPGTAGLDTTIMHNTFEWIEKNWNWESAWGWDYPMAAMCATRLGDSEAAVAILLKEELKNTYLISGHNNQGWLSIYLPGNGGLLTAIAMMCAGYEGSARKNPGFPQDWIVKWENLKPVF